MPKIKRSTEEMIKLDMASNIDYIFGLQVLEEIVSPINGKVTVCRDIAWGTHIQAEGLTQSGGVAAEIWKTALKKVKNQNLKVNNALILGLGGGSIAKIVSQYWPQAKITGVDIDPVMVELGKKYLGLDRLDIDIVIEDAVTFLKRCRQKYDLICIDTYKGDEYPKELEEQASLKRIKDLLNPDGVAVFNRLYYGEKRPRAVKFGLELEKIFPEMQVVYPEANIMYLVLKYTHV